MAELKRVEVPNPDSEGAAFVFTGENAEKEAADFRKTLNQPSGAEAATNAEGDAGPQDAEEKAAGGPAETKARAKAENK